MAKRLSRVAMVKEGLEVGALDKAVNSL